MAAVPAVGAVIGAASGAVAAVDAAAVGAAVDAAAAPPAAACRCATARRHCDCTVTAEVAALFDVSHAPAHRGAGQSVAAAAAALPPDLRPQDCQLVLVAACGDSVDAHEIAPRLWLGSAEPACNVDFLRSTGVGAIVNCAAEVPPPDDVTRRRAHLAAYTVVPLADTPFGDATPLLRAGADEVAAAVAAVPHGAVYVHCASGVSRSVAVLLAYLVAHRGMSLAAAAALVRARRPVAYPNYGFWCALRGMEAVAHDGASSVPAAALRLHRTALAHMAPAATDTDTL